MDTTKMRARPASVRKPKWFPVVELDAYALEEAVEGIRAALAQAMCHLDVLVGSGVADVYESTLPARPARPGKGKARDKAKRTLPRVARQTAQRTR